MNALRIKKSKLDIAKEIIGYTTIFLMWSGIFVMLAALS